MKANTECVSRGAIHSDSHCTLLRTNEEWCAGKSSKLQNTPYQRQMIRDKFTLHLHTPYRNTWCTDSSINCKSTPIFVPLRLVSESAEAHAIQLQRNSDTIEGAIHGASTR